MSVIDRIAYFQGRRDEVPNQVLARELAEAEDGQGIREIAENLGNKNPNVRSDCVKVLYEIGYLKPQLIAAYARDFLELMEDRHNRLVWGAMLALSTIAELRAGDIYPHQQRIVAAMSAGSVITVDNAVKVLAAVASRDDEYREAIWPHLLGHLETCRPKDVPQHAESTLKAVDPRRSSEFVAVLSRRMSDLSSSQAARVRKVVREAERR